MRWRNILEEYNPVLIHILQGSKIIAAGTLSRLDIVCTHYPIKPDMSSLVGHFCLEKEDVLHLVNCKTIMQYQQNNNL